MSEEEPMEDVMEDIEYQEAIEEVELLLFLLDGSGSMTQTNTHDKRKKVEHLMDVMTDFIPRIKSSSAAPRFRVQNVYFSDKPYPQAQYQTIGDFEIDNPVEKAGGGRTAIADTLLKSRDLIDEFNGDDTLPNDKYATVFLITDGRETSQGDVEGSASMLKGHSVGPLLATVGVGKDADEDLLLKIASEPTPRQIRHLDQHHLLQYMPNQDKLYLRAHEEGQITKKTAEALRRFVYVLSKTAKKEE
ncbi:MAG: VWA domain-containing protein [Candidatus Lokiarchaeota archaeon]|nr:VWA domain-containing protein [Candidatus Lokiarchaeota archaeon]